MRRCAPDRRRRHARQQLGEVDAQGDVVGGEVTGAERAEPNPALAVEEHGLRAETAVGDPAPVQGGGEAPDLGQRPSSRSSTSVERDALRLDVGDDRGERPDLRDGDRTRRVDAGVREQQAHQRTVLELGLEGQSGRAGEAAAQAQGAHQPATGGEAEGVPVDDVDVHGAARGRAGIPPVAGGVAVDELEPLERHTGVEQHARNVDPGGRVDTAPNPAGRRARRASRAAASRAGR